MAWEKHPSNAHPLEFAITLRPLGKLVQQRRFPPDADHIDRRLDRAILAQTIVRLSVIVVLAHQRRRDVRGGPR